MTQSNPFPAATSDPAGIFRVRDALYTVDLLTVGLVQLDLFTLLESGPRSAAEICETLKITERPADVMLCLFCSMGFLERSHGKLELTQLAREHFVSGSPWHLGAYFESFKDRPVAVDLLQVLRTGKPANWASEKDSKDWHKSMEDETFADKFTSAMDCRGAYLGPALARAVNLKQSARLLDIGGGSGVYACALAARNQHLRATVLEKAPVDRVAARWIEKRGFTGRVDVAARDMFQGLLPSGYDTHLYSNVLHDWDVPQVKSLIHRSRDALLPGGRILIHDAHLDREKMGPLEVAEYSVLLMHATEGRCYSVAEIESYLTEAGFTDITQTPTAAHRSVIAATRGR